MGAVDKAQKAVLAALISTSALAWIGSIQQPDMMIAMTTYDPLAISLFTASWTAGMAAMMFPAIVPMVMLYNTFVSSGVNKGSSITIQEEASPRPAVIRSFRIALFIASYLFVWALTGVALLVGWSIVMNNTIMTAGSPTVLAGIYGSILIIAGIYQFTPLKGACIGYCESPMSFFMRRWKDGTLGAVRMGLWHGMYCLGCCWAYFLLMLSMGWMNLLWMGLFAGLIFAEKMWSRGIWIARAAGVGLVITGILVILGIFPSLVSSASMNFSDGSMMTNDSEEMIEGSPMSMPNGDGVGQSSMNSEGTEIPSSEGGALDDGIGDRSNEDLSTPQSSKGQEMPSMNMK